MRAQAYLKARKHKVRWILAYVLLLVLLGIPLFWLGQQAPLIWLIMFDGDQPKYAEYPRPFVTLRLLASGPLNQSLATSRQAFILDLRTSTT